MPDSKSASPDHANPRGEAREDDEQRGKPQQAAAEVPGAAAAGETEEPRGDELAQQIEQLAADLLSANDRAMRAQAELENFRKRTRRDMEQERRYAMLPLLHDLLAVLDNLERAIEAAQQNQNADGLLEGVKMVAGQLHSVLEQHHCKRIAADGSTFDPHLHEALAQIPSDVQPAGTVVQVTRDGYQLHDRVIRPAQVFVSGGSGQEETATQEETSD